MSKSQDAHPTSITLSSVTYVTAFDLRTGLWTLAPKKDPHARFERLGTDEPVPAPRARFGMVSM